MSCELLYSVLVIAVIIVLKYVITFCQYLYKTWTIHQAIKHLRLPIKFHWLMGNLLEHPGSGSESLDKNIEWTQMSNKKYAFYLSVLKPIFAVNHPETVKEILKTSEPKQTSMFGAYKLLQPWLGGGLLVSSGSKWNRNRKLLTPGFHFDILKTHVDIHNSCVEVMMKKIEDMCKSHTYIDITRPIYALTLDIIVKCVFSSHTSIQCMDNDAYLEIIEEIKSLATKRFFNPLFFIDFIYFLTSNGRRFKKLVKLSHQRSLRIINNRRKCHVIQKGKDAKNHVDFLDILLLCRDEENKGLSDKEILDEVETFMFEGHDTTSSALSLALYNLAKFPQYQKRARQEVIGVMGDKCVLEWEDLSKLPYLTMCIKESLRMYPPVPFIGREQSTPTVIDGTYIPAGTCIDIPIWNLHHNEAVWGKEHLVYDPERFSEENVKNIDPYAFIPFSAGPRNCIGQVFAMNELKIVLGRMLNEFYFELNETHQVRINSTLTMQTESGIKMKFIKRLNKNSFII